MKIALICFVFIWLSYICSHVRADAFLIPGSFMYYEEFAHRRYVTDIPSIYEIHLQNYRQTPLIRSQNWRLQRVSHWFDPVLVIHFDSVLKTKVGGIDRMLYLEGRSVWVVLNAVQCHTRRGEAAASGNV